MAFGRERREITRIEAFSDAMFGFAATLLVVSLDVPMRFAALQQALLGFVPFALTFAALVGLWSAHNGFFRRFPLDDGYVIGVNSVMMFMILFYVYPLKFLAAGLVTAVAHHWVGPLAERFTADQLGTMFLIYGLGWSAVFFCFTLLYRHVVSLRDSLALTPAQVHEARGLAGYYAIYGMVGLLSAVVATTGIGGSFGLPGFVYGMLGPLCYWHARRHHRAAPVTAPVLDAGTEGSAIA